MTNTEEKYQKSVSNCVFAIYQCIHHKGRCQGVICDKEITNTDELENELSRRGTMMERLDPRRKIKYAEWNENKMLFFPKNLRFNEHGQWFDARSDNKIPSSTLNLLENYVVQIDQEKPNPDLVFKPMSRKN